MERLQSLELRLEARNKLAQLKNDMLVLKNICEWGKNSSLVSGQAMPTALRARWLHAPAWVAWPLPSSPRARPFTRHVQGSPSCVRRMTMPSGWRASTAARRTPVRPFLVLHGPTWYVGMID